MPIEHIVDSTPRLSVVLTHLEPHVYEHLPPSRDDTLLVELIVACLLYDEVALKDTDVVLNARLIRVLQQPEHTRIFKELLGTGLIRILTLPRSKYRADTPQQYGPLMARAFNIRTYKEKLWQPTDEQRAFYEDIDRILVSGLNVRLVRQLPDVSKRPNESNPFALWLARSLEQREQVVLIPEFEDIGNEAAKLLAKFCRDEESWIDFLRHHGEELLPGDEDQQFFRSQAYRCLKYIYGGNGLYRLIQSVFNGTYCYWEGADGKFFNGLLVEPPFVYRDEEESRFAEEQSKSLGVRSEEMCEELYLAPGIAQVIVAVRATDECRNARHALHKLRGHLGITTSDEISKLISRLRALTHCFADEVLTRIQKPSGTIAPWKIGFWVAGTMVSGFATAAVGLTTDIKLALHGANALLNGANTFATPVRNAVQSRFRAKAISNEMVRLLAVRSTDFEVPPEIAALRQKGESMSPTAG